MPWCRSCIRAGAAAAEILAGEIGVLLGELGDPQRRVRSVLIAGTNGKGSTAATLASILVGFRDAPGSTHRRIWRG
jgi:folylpolyglutamate synthase/dihydropteroate synthase